MYLKIFYEGVHRLPSIARGVHGTKNNPVSVFLSHIQEKIMGTCQQGAGRNGCWLGNPWPFPQCMPIDSGSLSATKWSLPCYCPAPFHLQQYLLNFWYICTIYVLLPNPGIPIRYYYISLIFFFKSLCSFWNIFF